MAATAPQRSHTWAVPGGGAAAGAQNAGVRRLSWIAVAALVAAGCGGSPAGTRAANQTERRAITRLVHHQWQYDSSYAAVRKLGLHDVVTQIRISQRDRHFARAEVAALDSHGKQGVESALLGLVLVAGKWTVAIGPGTDLGEICTASSPRPLVDLFCR